MPGAGELTGPLGHSGWLLVLGVGCVLAVVAGYALLAWRGLRPDARPRADRATAANLRLETLARIDAVGTEVGAGRLDRRGASTVLSPLVRGYVGSVTGRPVAAMTLTDLEASGLPRVPELVAVLYPPQFAPHTAGDTLELVARARDVVSTWR